MTGRDRRGWDVVERVDTAQALHDLDVDEGTGRSVWVCRPTEPAVVLGSTQPDATVDESARRASGFARARRRSGVGAVLVGPEDADLWVDVIVPRGDRLWSDDVGVAAHWVGESWCGALQSLGMPAATHRAGLVRRPWSDLVCFGGLGPGEVVSDGRKVVGLAQRRTRAGARFQTLVLRRWRPEVLLGLLALAAGERDAARRDLAVAAVGTEVSPSRLLDAFVESLPVT
jgi:lipoate-protein ligase A